MKFSKINIICNLIRLSGVPWFLRTIIARKKVTIINYHSPCRAVFESHMRVFSRLYNIISLEQLYNALVDNDISKLPSRALVVTLDDGHKSNIALLDIIKRYNVPVMIYVVSGLTDTNRHFWWKVDGMTQEDILDVKTLDDSHRRQVLSEKFDHIDEKEYSAPHALSSKDLVRLKNAGASVGSHTVFHPEMSKCIDEVGIYECCKSKEMLEGIIGENIMHFAYPSGAYHAQSKQWLQKAGYKTARTIKSGWVTVNTDVFELPNFGISDDACVSKAIVQASGLWDMLKGIFAKG
jgi:peptidoglycan/xylan/chitin deacetylase (PgdA/CDA1 family)